MQCPRCNARLDDDTVFCGNCGTQIAPFQATGATIASSPADEETMRVQTNTVGNKQFVPTAQRVSPRAELYTPSLDTPARDNAPHTPRRGRSPLASARGRVIIALALIVLVGGALGLFAVLKNNSNGTNISLGTHATGQIAFIDNAKGSAGHTDALTMSIQNLETPPAGFQYDAWLVNNATEQNIALGSLVANGSTFALNYSGDGSNGQAGTNLIGAGDEVKITLEQGNATAPTGRVILSATFPPKAFIHIRHLLFSFPITPGKIGLLVGLLAQAQLLNAQALLLSNASTSHNTSAIQCASQSILDIIEGAQGAAYQTLPTSCNAEGISASGDGFGLLGNTGYVALASAHASLAATQSDSTDLIRLHAGHVEIAMANIKGWATTVEQDALVLRTAPANTALISEIATLADHINHGVDINGDEHVDPVPGEAGAITAYNHGQLMATLQFVAGV